MIANRLQLIHGSKLQGKICFWFSLLVALFLSATAAFANHNVCTLKASGNEVWVRVFDVDRDGNIMRGHHSYGFISREVLWDGILAQGERSEIKSSSGQIRYDYKVSSDDRAYGNNSATCSHGEVIMLP
jgi:hypothetical protein